MDWKWWLLLIIIVGFQFDDEVNMPVVGATRSDYNQDSFWYYPWGRSVTHKGVDIFAKKGTDLHAPTDGIVVYSGEMGIGGNVVIILGAKWRLHYLAHLEEISTGPFNLVTSEKKVGTVGNSGNAAGKPSHLHYSIISLIPYPWRIDGDIQGWKKMFFLNPIEKIEEESA